MGEGVIAVGGRGHIFADQQDIKLVHAVLKCTIIRIVIKEYLSLYNCITCTRVARYITDSRNSRHRLTLHSATSFRIG